MRKLLKVFSFITLIAFMVACDSHSKDIQKRKETLLYSSGEKGKWKTSYSYDFVNDIKLHAVEEITLTKNGNFIEETTYYYEGDPMAKTILKGTWDIVYEEDLGAFFFDQDYKDEMDVKNLHFTNQWFEKFDTDIRLTRNGDAYDVLEYENDEDTIYGNEIIDYNSKLFLIKSLSDGEVYRYTPAVN